MNKNKIIAFLVGLLMVNSCADPDLAPIITFDSAGKGAYAALITETARNYNFFDLDNSSYTYSVEFIDLEKGNLVSEYNVDVYYEDRNTGNGDISAGPARVKSFSAADFQTNDNGNQGVSNITLTASELISALGLNKADMSGGDRFRIDGAVVTKDGQTFRAGNSSAAVNGAAFRGHLGFNLSLVCPSDLAGDMNYTTSAWCGGDPISGTVTWVKTGANGYTIANGDFSYGAYEVCYGAGSTLPIDAGSDRLKIVDDCNNISMSGTSRWDEVYTISITSVDGATIVFDWENSYGEGGNTTLTRADGANWPALKTN